MNRHWHRPHALAWLLAAGGIALLLALGTWQTRRAGEKEQLFAAFEGAAAQAPVSLAEARSDADGARHPRVQVPGRFVHGPGWLLDNQVRDGRVGVMAFALFEPDDGSPPLLVNRGFLPRTGGGELPVPPPLPGGSQSLDALLAPPPGAGLRLGGNRLGEQPDWPKLVIYLDPAEIADDLARPLDARVLLMLPAPDSPFLREWQPQVFPPARHRAYAFTWFTFAAVVVAAFVALHWRRPDASTPE